MGNLGQRLVIPLEPLPGNIIIQGNNIKNSTLEAKIYINLINKIANFIKKNSTYNLFFFIKIFFIFFILIIISLILFKLYLFVINFSMLGK